MMELLGFTVNFLRFFAGCLFGGRTSTISAPPRTLAVPLPFGRP